MLSPKSTVWDAQRLVTGGDDRGIVVVDKHESGPAACVSAAALAKADAGTRLADLLDAVLRDAGAGGSRPEGAVRAVGRMFDGSRAGSSP